MNITARLQTLAITFTKALPLKASDRVASGLGSLFCSVSKRGRRTIERNMEHIFACDGMTQKELNRHVRNTYINYARCMVDFLRLAYIEKDDFSVEMIGLENVVEALRFGRGCILLTMHIGNWDYAGSYLASRGVPMSALVEETAPEMYELYTRHRERLGMKTFPLSRAGYGFLHTIKNNRVLAVLGDRDVQRTGVPVRFFDGRRNVPRGLGDIAIKKQIPVVFGYMVLNPAHKEHRYLGYIDRPQIFTGTESDFNAVMVERFEGFIRAYPDQWMSFESDWLE